MLVPNFWYAVAESTEVSPRRPLGVTRFGQPLVFWRDADGRVVGMTDRCPHRGSKLSLGRITNGHIQCPFHGFEFDAAGACQLIPANGRGAKLPRGLECATVPCREAHGFVWAWYGERRDSYPPVPWFESLDGFRYATFRKTWDVDLSRAVEAHLDVSHLPFVHPRTIGRDGKTLVNGPYTTLENDVLRVWITNQPDEGLPAVKPTQLPPPQAEPSITFLFPNVWQLRIANRVRAVTVLAPIEDGRCAVYSQSYLKLPLPGPLVRFLARVSNVFNGYVLGEDYRVVRTQRPKVSGLGLGERYIPADRPIAVYHQHCQRLAKATTVGASAE
jgi:phenylpropionate dioxygenase-like ring-hydroxylating dioxygenase large terminal subunit